MKKLILYLSILSVLCFCGCKQANEAGEKKGEHVVENTQDEENKVGTEGTTGKENTGETHTEEESVKVEESDSDEITAPTKEEVLFMRELALEGMSKEERTRLTENIKVANQQMEEAYFYEDLFGKLEDSEHLYWNYIEQKGDIQVGWEEDGTPLMVYNRFHADNFIALMEEMRDSLKNDMLKGDFDNLIRDMQLAKDTHRVEYVERIYCILHDMDYFLLRYGIEDVGKYLDDLSTVKKYYGALEIYGEGLPSIPTPSYLTDIEDEVYRNLITELIEADMPLRGWMPYAISYAILDIDEDGREELILNGANASAMATMAYHIYDYDRSTGEVYLEFACWPDVDFLDNGYVKEEASHNHGRSNLDDFWPYHLLLYNEETDQYETVAQIDAWQKELYPEEFPDAADKDGDGIVYYTADTQFWRPATFMDKAEYDTWCEQYNKGTAKKIQWKAIMSEEDYVTIYMKDAVG